MQAYYDSNSGVCQSSISLGKIDTENFGGFTQRLTALFIKSKDVDNRITYAFQFDIEDDNATTQIVEDNCPIIMVIKGERLDFRPLGMRREYFRGKVRVESFQISPFSDQNIRDMFGEKEVKFKIYAQDCPIIGTLNKWQFAEMKKIYSEKKTKRGKEV